MELNQTFNIIKKMLCFHLHLLTLLLSAPGLDKEPASEEQRFSASDCRGIGGRLWRWRAKGCAAGESCAPPGGTAAAGQDGVWAAVGHR